MERVTIVKHKLPDATGELAAYRVAEDEFGTWFFSPATSPIVWTNIEGKSPAWEFDVLTFAPHDDWYFALWWNGHPSVEIGVDVSTPTTHLDQVWSWIDLEIDVHRFTDGRVETEDEDEFEESVAKGFIDDVQKAEALRITPIIERMLRERVEPFGDVGRRRLDEAVALGLPPL